MDFNEFYQYLHAIQQVVKPRTTTPDKQAEVINDLFLFLNDSRTHIFPEPLCTKAIQYFCYFVEEILPHLGCDPTAQQEIAGQYTELITHLIASRTRANQLEQELGKIIKKLRDGVADLDNEFTGTLLLLFQQFLTTQDSQQAAFLAALQAQLPPIREKYTEKQIGDLFDQFLHVLTVEKPEIASQPELSNFRELFGYILRSYFAGNTVLIHIKTGQGRIVPLRVLVDRHRAGVHVEFWHHTVDHDMQASADIARFLARKYLLEEFERDLPEQAAICCQFLYPAEEYRDASASLMIGLQMIGEVLGLEGDPQTVVTGAVDQYGNVLGVGWIPQKFNAIQEYEQITRLRQRPITCL